MPLRLHRQAPFLILPGNGKAFKLVRVGDSLWDYRSMENGAEIVRLAERLWATGLEGDYSGINARDMPTLVLEMEKGHQKRTISVYAYAPDSVREEGGRLLDSLLAAVDKAKTSRQTWEPEVVELHALAVGAPEAGGRAGWRIYDWEGPELPLDSLAESYLSMELSGDSARSLLESLRGKTVYTRKDMALFRIGDRFYAVAVLPVVR